MSIPSGTGWLFLQVVKGDIDLGTIDLPEEVAKELLTQTVKASWVRTVKQRAEVLVTSDITPKP